MVGRAAVDSPGHSRDAAAGRLRWARAAARSPVRWPAGDRRRLRAPSRCRCAARKDRSPAAPRARCSAARRADWRPPARRSAERDRTGGSRRRAAARAATAAAPARTSTKAAAAGSPAARRPAPQIVSAWINLYVSRQSSSSPASSGEGAPKYNSRKVLPKYGRGALAARAAVRRGGGGPGLPGHQPARVSSWMRSSARLSIATVIAGGLNEVVRLLPSLLGILQHRAVL